MSIGLQFDLSSVARLQERIARLANPDRKDLLEQLASRVESQTRRRISEEEESPDGQPWQAWTASYAATRSGGASLLQGASKGKDKGIGGGLIDSITYEIKGDEALIGSNLEYAAIHQYGGTPGMKPGPAGIPARPYLGYSPENLADLEEIADRWLDKHLEEA